MSGSAIQRPEEKAAHICQSLQLSGAHALIPPAAVAAAALFGWHQSQLLQPSYVDSLPATLQGASGRVRAAEASSLID